MTHLRFLRAILPIVAAATSLLALPASAHAILVGMESNRELVNTTELGAPQLAALDKMQQQGVQVVRANFRWYEIANNCGGNSAKALENPDHPCYQWAQLDTFVKGANDRKMSVLLSIQQNPSWANNSSNPFFMGGTQAEFNFVQSHFTAFYKAAGARYKQGSPKGFVKYWTIHNEPNSKVFWGATPNPARYAQLYGRTAVALRAANPGALIAPGPTGPTGGSKGIKPRLFLQQFQANVGKYLPGSTANKKKYINAYAHNPYPGNKTQPTVFSPTLHRDSISMGTIDRLIRQLDASPLTRGTKIWATEFGWQTPPDFTEGTTFARQAQFIPEAFDWLDSRRRVQIGISYGLTDPSEMPDWQSGTFTNAGVRKLSFYSFQRMISVPQGGLTGRVRPNTRVRIWGRSNVNPTGTRLAWRLVGGKCDSRAAVNGFCMVPGQKGAPGTPGAKVGFLTIRRGQRIDFAVYDTVSKSYGRTRRIFA